MEKQFRIGQIMAPVQGQKVNCYKNCGQTKYNSITDSKKEELKNKITEYKDYLSEQKDIARKSFKCISIEYYNDTGRIKYMEFTEK